MTAKFEHLSIVLLLVITAGFFVHLDLLWRWDYLIYDTQLSLWSRPVPDDIIIVEIDDESLNQIGRWPWPRSIHAELIKRLELESPRAIGLDIILSEPDTHDPEADRFLSQVIAQSGKVVLPVFMSRQSRNAVPIESLPIPEFTRFAAALGHVHVDIDKDGIVRKVFMREGIGKPHWEHYSLALLSLISDQVSESVPDSSNIKYEYSPMQWSREQPLLIPYSGPSGHYRSIGYSQVLGGNYPAGLFHNKIVLIGAVAEGLGDALPTPLSNQGGTMPGVEIIANMLDALRNDLRIEEISRFSLVILTLLLVAIPILVYPYLNPAHTLLFMIGMIVTTILGVALLLWSAGIWIPAANIVLFQLLSYPLWSWRRLVLAMRHLNHELDQMMERQSVFSFYRERNLALELEFISILAPLQGWIVLNDQGARIMHQGTVPLKPRKAVAPGHWLKMEDQYWTQMSYQGRPCYLGLRLASADEPGPETRQLMDNLLQNPEKSKTPQAPYLEDVIQTRIAQVQSMAEEYENLHTIIDDSIAGMADGVLICNSYGQVLFSNRRAGWYLKGDDHATINGLSLMHTLLQVNLNNNQDWVPILQQALLHEERVVCEGQHSSGRQLMIEISPLRIKGSDLAGLVLNFSDISLLKASEQKRNEILNFLSHDLRSPLSSMLAMIELTRCKKSTDEMIMMLDDMEKNTHKTLHLAEQFLQLSRANTHEKLEFYDIDINSIVLNAIDQLWGLSNKLNIPIEYDFDYEELWSKAEPDLLERALINLLSNALKHSDEGHKVSVNVSLEDDHIVCCVKDEGSGIAEEDLPHLFEMFKRTRSASISREKGVGLGLAFVDAVARRHSGYVDVKSETGKGSRFCLIFPRVEVSDAG